MFNVRMDFEIDGPNNAVYEVDMEIPEHNPTHTAFKAVDRLLETEQAAIRKTDTAKHRFWKIANRDSKNIVNEPVAYRLIPTDGIQLAAGDESYVSKRAQFARNNLWVTAYDRTERFAAGEFPNQATGATTACTSGPRPTGTSSIRTSSSGTPSACTTSSASKTGPSCPARTSASCSNPTASSTRTPP